MRTQRHGEAEVGGGSKDRPRLLNGLSHPTSASPQLCVRIRFARLTRVDVDLPELTAVDQICDCAKRTQSKPTENLVSAQLASKCAMSARSRLTKRTQRDASLSRAVRYHDARRRDH